MHIKITDCQGKIPETENDSARVNDGQQKKAAEPAP
ncbi:hypothetical protein EMIT048CA2_160083 [Pseudomonas chlororaphis]